MLLPYPSYHTFDFALNCKDKLIRFFFPASSWRQFSSQFHSQKSALLGNSHEIHSYFVNSDIINLHENTLKDFRESKFDKEQRFGRHSSWVWFQMANCRPSDLTVTAALWDGFQIQILFIWSDHWVNCCIQVNCITGKKKSQTFHFTDK